MVRRVGFGGDEQPNKRDAELRQKYHRADGNHSDRAHTIGEPPQPARRPRPEGQPVSPFRALRLVVLGFFVLPFIIAILGWLFLKVFLGEGGGSFRIFGLIIVVLIVSRIFRFIKKALDQAQR